MKKTFVSYEAGLKEDLADPEEAAAYLTAALEEGSQEVFLRALHDVLEARGVTTATTRSVSTQKVFSDKGILQLSSLKALLDSMGLKLSIEVKDVAA